MGYSFSSFVSPRSRAVISPCRNRERRTARQMRQIREKEYKKESGESGILRRFKRLRGLWVPADRSGSRLHERFGSNVVAPDLVRASSADY